MHLILGVVFNIIITLLWPIKGTIVLISFYWKLQLCCGSISTITGVKTFTKKISSWCIANSYDGDIDNSADTYARFCLLANRWKYTPFKSESSHSGRYQKKMLK